MLTQLEEKDGKWIASAYYSSNIWEIEYDTKPTTSDIINEVKRRSLTPEHQQYLKEAMARVEGK